MFYTATLYLNETITIANVIASLTTLQITLIIMDVSYALYIFDIFITILKNVMCAISSCLSSLYYEYYVLLFQLILGCLFIIVQVYEHN